MTFAVFIAPLFIAALFCAIAFAFGLRPRARDWPFVISFYVAVLQLLLATFISFKSLSFSISPIVCTIAIYGMYVCFIIASIDTLNLFIHAISGFRRKSENRYARVGVFILRTLAHLALCGLFYFAAMMCYF